MAPNPIRQWIDDCAFVAPQTRGFRRMFAAGSIMALIVVAARVALPWPLKAALDPWLSKAPDSTSPLLGLNSEWIASFAVLAGAYLLLLVMMGFADYRERLLFAKFAIGTTHRIRARAMDAATWISCDGAGGVDRGDLIARLVGDIARVKSGVQGFLVHVATNGAMYVGVATVLFFIDPWLGFVIGGAGVVTAALTTWGAVAIYRRATQHRSAEGALATAIHQAQAEEAAAGAFGDANESSRSHEATLTQITGRVTWAAHVIFGASVVICLALGVRGATVGRIDGGDLAVFILYAIMMRSPIVQLARQGARTGKIMACLERVVEIIRLGDSPAEKADELPPLRGRLDLINVLVRSSIGSQSRRMIGPLTLTIHRGERIALVGGPGDGKTALLQAILGVGSLEEGRLIWDGIDLTGVPQRVRHTRVAMVSGAPTWRRQPLRELLRSNGEISDAAMTEAMRSCGGQSILKRLPRGLDSKSAAIDFSPGERRIIAVARLLLGGSSLLLLDDPTAGLPKRQTRKLVRAVLGSAEGRTVVMAFGCPVRLSRFDRVVVLRRGRIAYDGSPAEWRSSLQVGRDASSNTELSPPMMQPIVRSDVLR